MGHELFKAEFGQYIYTGQFKRACSQSGTLFASVRSTPSMYFISIVTCLKVNLDNELTTCPSQIRIMSILLDGSLFIENTSALLWQKEASDIPSKFELLMFS